MNTQADVLIIGGGVIGVCAAYYLAERGCSVTLIEKGGICAGSSYGNAGLIVPGHAVPMAAPGVLSRGLRWLSDPESPFYIKPRPDPELIRWLWRFRAACKEEPMRRAIPVLLALGRASAGLFDHLASGGEPRFGYEQKGRFMLFKSQPGFAGEVEEAHLLEEFGVPHKILSAADVRERVPNALPSVVGGVYYPEEAHLIPHQFVHEMARLAESRGACIRTNTEVLGFATTGRRIAEVITTRGNLRSDQVVLAAGAWSSPLARELGFRLPIQPAKGYSITVKRPPGSSDVPVLLGESKVAVTPMGETLRFAGTLELAGLDLSVNRRRVDAIRRAVPAYLSDVDDLDLVEVWRGLRPATPDGLPIIGRTRAIENLVVASGHGMLGISLGPITGQLVAQIASGEAPSINLTPLTAERFS